ncbi:hypothetical protein GBF38_008299, partial [Nibea albiflora]
ILDLFFFPAFGGTLQHILVRSLHSLPRLATHRKIDPVKLEMLADSTNVDAVSLQVSEEPLRSSECDGFCHLLANLWAKMRIVGGPVVRLFKQAIS